MNCAKRPAILLLLLGTLGGCASVPDDVISRPDVTLADLEVTVLGFDKQTILLSFNIDNPNAFPLPVNRVSYGIRLDGQRFASGDTPCDFLIPANGDTQMSLSVDLDLLSTAPQLLSIVREGARNDVPYLLEGQFGLDLPEATSVRYRKDGTIRLNSGGL